MSIKIVSEGEYGLYIWVTDSGDFLADTDGNIMNIPSQRGDRSKIEALERAAKYYYGDEGGKAVFYGNHRRVTDDEFEEQQARKRMGLVPDPLDHTAMREELEYAKKFD